MKNKSNILLASAIAFCSVLFTGVASAETRPEWSDGARTFVFLKDLGPVDRFTADTACTSRGLKPLTSTANCGGVQVDILECLGKLEASFETYTKSLKSSPLWAMLPMITRPDELSPEVPEHVKGVWFHPECNFESVDAGKISVRFYALQQLDIENAVPSTESSDFAKTLLAQEKLSVICLK